ncbi:uncharacterized protein LOC128720845 [Anopheles nili]|uniref:uncharacterized protein LOC128720845 n=1 Tax=Anopheles nili TaxID=185578 RepID=UPI00237A51E6|nr:uncharacterized protein LOC128720845 [Anopheles nili]
MVARAGRSRFFACLGLLILMVGFVTMFHNSQQQLDELRQLGLRCEQQQKSVQAQMEVLVDQKLRLENSLESERMINEANRKESKQKAKEEQEEHSKSSMEANIRYASLQQQCNLVKSQLGDLTEECSRSKKQQSEEINSLRLKTSELQGKVQRFKQESANDVEHLKALIEQLKSDKYNLEASLRRQLGEKDHVIEKIRDLATKMEKENAFYLERCKLPADQRPKQHHRYQDVLEALSLVAAKANAAKASVHNFNEQLSVSEDLYRIPVALKHRSVANLATSSTTVSIGLSPSTSSSSSATNNRSAGRISRASEEQETRVIANPFELLPRANPYVERNPAGASEDSKINLVGGGGDTASRLHPALDGGIINSVENFQIIPKPLPAVAAPDGSQANNVLQEPRLLKTSTSVSTNGKRYASSDRNLQVPILAAPTMLPGPSVEHSSKRSNSGVDGGGGTVSGSRSSTTSTTTSPSVSRGAGVAPNRSSSSVARKPLSNRHTKPVPVGIVPFPDMMPELEENISENILDNRYANVAAAVAGMATGGFNGAGAASNSLGVAKKGRSDKQRAGAGGVAADLNFLNGGTNLDTDNGAHEVQDGETGVKRTAAGGVGGQGGEGVAPAGDDDQLAMGNENNLNAAEEDTNLYDNGNEAAGGNKPQFGGNPLLDQQIDYNDVIVPGHGVGRSGDQNRRVAAKRREGGAVGGIESKGGVIIDRMGDKLINEIAHDHGKEGDNYPNEMEDLHLVGNEAEEEDVSDYDDPTALKQGHAERN